MSPKGKKLTRPQTNTQKDQVIRSLKGQLKGRSAEAAGALTLRREERWAATPTATSSGYGILTLTMAPGASGLSHLDRFGQLFELYRFKRCHVRYKPAVGTTESGMVHFGADFDPLDLPKSVNGVTALQPLHSGAVWQSGSISLPLDLVNRGAWRYTAAGPARTSQEYGPSFAVMVASNSAKAGGEIWIDYEIELRSPTTSGQTLRDTSNLSSGYSWNRSKSTLAPIPTQNVHRGILEVSDETIDEYGVCKAHIFVRDLLSRSLYQFSHQLVANLFEATNPDTQNVYGQTESFLKGERLSLSVNELIGIPGSGGVDYTSYISELFRSDENGEVEFDINYFVSPAEFPTFSNTAMTLTYLLGVSSVGYSK